LEGDFKMSNEFAKTPEEKREEFVAAGFSPNEVEMYTDLYKEKYRKHQLSTEDVLKTDQALEYINTKLVEAKLVHKTKDKLTITNLRELIVKPNEKGVLVGRIMPLDTNPPKKIGFHINKVELDKFLEEEIKFREVTKEELYKEVQRLREENEDLKKKLNEKESIDFKEEIKEEINDVPENQMDIEEFVEVGSVEASEIDVQEEVKESNVITLPTTETNEIKPTVRSKKGTKQKKPYITFAEFVNDNKTDNVLKITFKLNKEAYKGTVKQENGELVELIAANKTLNGEALEVTKEIQEALFEKLEKKRK
jgi:hypothetical protein